MTAGSFIPTLNSSHHFERTFSPFTFSSEKYPNLQPFFSLSILLQFSVRDLYCDMKDKVSPPAAATATATVTKPSVASETTANDVLPSDFVKQEESSIMDSQKNKPSKWTNEKHSLYLKSIEASFVDQLYSSLDIKGCQTQSTCSSDANSMWKNHPNACIQFKVLHGGCWSKRSFKRDNSQLKDANRPDVSLGNSWIQHFTSASRHGAIAVPSLQRRVSLPKSQLNQETDCSNTEVSDQNFVEDTVCRRKRARTSIISHLSNDQVVPFCASVATETPDGYVSSKK